MNPLTEQFRLGNGVTIPALGFGTWQIPNGRAAYDAVARALADGYRHIDTARAYGNEAAVGRAIADSGLGRDEVFITTKVPAEVKDRGLAKAAFEESVGALGVDHVDLYLIHAPWPWSQVGADYAAGNAEVWTVMSELYDAGRARSIGVSNFDIDDIEKLVATTGVVPHANQIQFHVGNTADDVTAYCQGRGILVEGYSPLATGRILGNAEIAAVAQRYGRSSGQLCLRYVYQKGVLPLPKSVTPARIAENADLDFEISADDMTRLDAIIDAEH